MMTFPQSREESILNCVLIKNRGFIYIWEIKKHIDKISDVLEEGRTATAGKVKRE